METKIDTSFQTMQRDLFSSGMAAQIGMSAFGLWQAIKSHADHFTGESFAGMRRLGELTGMSVGTVQASVKILEEAKLLRVTKQGKGKRGNLYVARERLDVRLGSRVLCTIVIDYVPHKMRHTLAEVADAFQGGQQAPESLAECEIIPGEGFLWDGEKKALRAAIPVAELEPEAVPALSDDPLVRRVQEIAARRVTHKDSGDRGL